VFHNWKTWIKAKSESVLFVCRGFKDGSSGEDQEDDDRSSSGTNYQALMSTDGKAPSPPMYGVEVDAIEYYQVLLEQYNELVETKQQEFICWHAWHEKLEYRNATQQSNAANDNNSGAGHDQ
jgi:hypothetical protein